MKSLKITLTERSGKKNGVRYRLIVDDSHRFFALAEREGEHVCVFLGYHFESAVFLFRLLLEKEVSPCHIGDVVEDMLLDGKNL